MNKAELEAQTENIQRVASWYTSKDPVVISIHEDRLLEVARGYGAGNTKPGDYLNEFNNLASLYKRHTIQVFYLQAVSLDWAGLELF